MIQSVEINKSAYSKYLFVGDPHVTANNIEDSEKLITFCEQICDSRNIKHIIFLGDLFDTHGVVRLEVLTFWQKSIKRLLENYTVTIIVGNHDMILGQGKHSGVHSLKVFKDMHKSNLNIVDEPALVDGIGFIPYTHNEIEFMKKADFLHEKGATELLICHQTFQGCSYENGFYAEDGFDVNRVPQKNIISGHIHKTQTIGKCFYPGTPKWDKSSDSGQPKGIWIIDLKDLSKEFISTEKVVTPMYTISIKEGNEIPELNPDAKIILELHGSSQWISKIKKQLKSKVSIRSFPIDRKVSKIDFTKLETVEEYASNFHFNFNVRKEDVVNYLKEVSNVR